MTDTRKPVSFLTSRRALLKGLAGAAALGSGLPAGLSAWAADAQAGRIKQSVCLWCYNGFMKREKMELDAFAAACAAMGLKSIELVGPGEWPALKKHAEEKKVTVCMEFLNSVNHKDYMADSTQWCVELVRRVNSPRVKVLYDIYHAAMMKEDVLADIQKHADCWGHYHTGGMPGRNEIDGTQTLDFAKLMRAIADTGYTGYVGQEFIPKRPDALKSLQEAVALCNV